jgi:hypothetical protein
MKHLAQGSFRSGDLRDPAALVCRLKTEKGPLQQHLASPACRLAPETLALLAAYDGAAHPPGPVQDALVAALNDAVANGGREDDAEEGDREALSAKGLRHALKAEIGAPPSRKRRLQRLIVRVLQDLTRSGQQEPVERDELLQRLLPERCQEWLPVAEMALAYRALEELGEVGALLRIGKYSGAPGEYYVLSRRCPDEAELERRLDDLPDEPKPIGTTERLAFILLLAVDLLAMWIFYVRFMPQEFKVEATAFNTAVTGLAGLAGLRGFQSLGGLPTGDSPRTFRWFGWAPAVAMLLVFGSMVSYGFANPCIIRTVPGARISVDGKEQPAAARLSDGEAWRLVDVPLLLSWNPHKIAVKRQFYTDLDNGNEDATTLVNWTWRQSTLPGWTAERDETSDGATAIVRLHPTVYLRLEDVNRAPRDSQRTTRQANEVLKGVGKALKRDGKSWKKEFGIQARITEGKGAYGLLVKGGSDGGNFGLYRLIGSRAYPVGTVEADDPAHDSLDVRIAKVEGAITGELGLLNVWVPDETAATGRPAKMLDPATAADRNLIERLQARDPGPEARRNDEEAARQRLGEINRKLALAVEAGDAAAAAQQADRMRSIGVAARTTDVPALSSSAAGLLRAAVRKSGGNASLKAALSASLADVQKRKPLVYIQYSEREAPPTLERLRTELTAKGYQVADPQRIPLGGLPRTSDVRYKQGDQKSADLAQELLGITTQVAGRPVRLNGRPYGNWQRFEVWLAPPGPR